MRTFPLCPSPSLFGAKRDVETTDLLVKASHGEIQIRAVDDAPEGTIEGYGSKFGLVDSYGETVIKGAFKESLREWKRRKRPIPMLWQHRSDQPIGGWHTFEEDDVGLKLSGLLNLETQRGKEAWSDVKAQNVGGLSIGYYEVEADPWGNGGGEGEARRLKKLDLRETSVVTFPALREAQIDAVKARIARGEALTEREFEAFLREKMNVSRAAAETINRHGYRAWRQREAGQADQADEVVEAIRSFGELPRLKLPAL